MQRVLQVRQVKKVPLVGRICYRVISLNGPTPVAPPDFFLAGATVGQNYPVIVLTGRGAIAILLLRFNLLPDTDTVTHT